VSESAQIGACNIACALSCPIASPFVDPLRLVIPRKKLERLKREPEKDWDLMWNTTIIYALFPNTLLMMQGDHVELALIFPSDGRVDRAVMDLALYVPKAPTTDEEHSHWDKNMKLVLDVVTGEDFPAGRTIQEGLTSGAQTHVIYGRNEPAMIHYHQSLRRALSAGAPNSAARCQSPQVRHLLSESTARGVARA
jgi:hypothetical protein